MLGCHRTKLAVHQKRTSFPNLRTSDRKTVTDSQTDKMRLKNNNYEGHYWSTGEQDTEGRRRIVECSSQTWDLRRRANTANYDRNRDRNSKQEVRFSGEECLGSEAETEVKRNH